MQAPTMEELNEAIDKLFKRIIDLPVTEQTIELAEKALEIKKELKKNPDA